MLIKDVMHSPVITVEETASLEAAYQIMLQRNIRHVPVVRSGHLAGMVTDRDIRLATSPFAPGGARSVQTAVALVMTQPVVTADPLDPVEEAARVMRQKKIGALPVLDGNQLIGIVTGIDLLDALLRLTGVQKPSGRLEVRLDDRPGELAHICTLLADRGINIHSLLTYPYDDSSVSAVFRVGAVDTRRLAKEFYDARIEVIWPPVFKG